MLGKMIENTKDLNMVADRLRARGEISRLQELCKEWLIPEKDTHYKKLIEEAGLPYIRFHDLRHTYTTLLMKNDINQKAIAASLGHSKSIITFDVYTDKQALIEGGVEEIDAFIDEVHPYDSEDIQILKEKYGKKVLHRLA